MSLFMELPKRTVGNGIGKAYTENLAFMPNVNIIVQKIVFNAYLIAAKYVINSIQYAMRVCNMTIGT